MKVVVLTNVTSEGSKEYDVVVGQDRPKPLRDIAELEHLLLTGSICPWRW